MRIENQNWNQKNKFFLNAAFCGFEIYNHCNARQLKMGAEIFCQFWFSVWVSDLDLRRDQIENANFVHLTLFVIYWEMCTNSISGHHLQMAQGVARIDRTMSLSRKPKTKKMQIPLTQKPKNPKPHWKICTDPVRFFCWSMWIPWFIVNNSLVLYSLCTKYKIVASQKVSCKDQRFLLKSIFNVFK